MLTENDIQELQDHVRQWLLAATSNEDMMVRYRAIIRLIGAREL